MGCQITGNRLFSVFPDADGFSSIGFKSNFGSATIAYLFMQLHITIAFAVFLHPAFYVLERLLLGMHRVTDSAKDALPYRLGETPKDVIKRSSCASWSVTSHQHLLDGLENDEGNVEATEYKGITAVLKYVMLRMLVIALLVVLAVVLRHMFIDMSDFIGACANTILCILIPIAFYLKKFGAVMIMWSLLSSAKRTLIACGRLDAAVDTEHAGREKACVTSGGSLPGRLLTHACSFLPMLEVAGQQGLEVEVCGTVGRVEGLCAGGLVHRCVGRVVSHLVVGA